MQKKKNKPIDLAPKKTVLKQLRCLFTWVQDNFGTSEPVPILSMSNIVYFRRAQHQEFTPMQILSLCDTTNGSDVVDINL